MAEILDPADGESICDPACGSGGLLVESVNHVRDAGGDPRTLRIYGQEINQTTAAIARMNLYLHDIETFDIKRGDTLRDPKLKNPDGSLQQFDILVANPPFSLKNWGREGWAEDPYGRSSLGVPPASYGDLAFVEHMLASMNENGGRMAVVMPHGVLFRAGVEREIRKNLINSGHLEAVIGLAPNLFYNTTIPACILVCRSTMTGDRAGGLLFVDGSKRFKAKKNQNELTSDDVAALVEAFATGKDPDGEDGVRVRSIGFDEIEEGDWDLNIGRYIQRDAEAEIEVATAIAEWEEARDALRETEEALEVRLKEAGLGA